MLVARLLPIHALLQKETESFPNKYAMPSSADTGNWSDKVPIEGNKTMDV